MPTFPWVLVRSQGEYNLPVGSFLCRNDAVLVRTALYPKYGQSLKIQFLVEPKLSAKESCSYYARVTSNNEFNGLVVAENFRFIEDEYKGWVFDLRNGREISKSYKDLPSVIRGETVVWLKGNPSQG